MRHERRQQMKKRDKTLEAKLKTLAQTRDRTPLPRPAVMKDKTKYNRKAERLVLRKVLEKEG